VAGIEGQGHPLELSLRVGRRGVDILVQDHGSGRGVQAVEVVLDDSAGQLVGYHEDLLAAQVDHGRRGNADGRVDVSAGEVTGRHRSRQSFLPEGLTGRGGQGHDRVGLGGHEDLAPVYEGLTVEFAAQLR
jgi:hypothetical protein